MMDLKLTLLLCALTTVLSSTSAQNASYVCYSDDSIDVSGLPADFYYFAMQEVTNGSDVECNVTTTSNTSIKITGCVKDRVILLTYSTYSGMATHSIHGGRTVSAVKVMCSEISEAGEVHRINNTFAANLTIDFESEVNPTYQVTSSLSTSSTTVGSSVTWTISFPVEYILEVTNCTAYAGTNDLSADKVNLITLGGCNVTDELISNFKDNRDGTATATILAFKFYNNDDVFLKCNLKVCPNGSKACDTQCSRQKRDIHERTARAAADPTGSDEFYAKEVHGVLHVIDPNASGAMKVSYNLVMALTIILAIFTKSILNNSGTLPGTSKLRYSI